MGGGVQVVGKYAPEVVARDVTNSVSSNNYSNPGLLPYNPSNSGLITFTPAPKSIFELYGLNLQLFAEKNKGNSIKLREIEITNELGGTLGEFDEIDLKNGIFYEDKSAKGLDIVHPRTGLPTQTPQQFADKQIYNKTKTRINNLAEAVGTREAKTNSLEVPTIDELKSIKEFKFRLDGNTPELKNAVENSLNKLRLEFPEYKFSAEFGK